MKNNVELYSFHLFAGAGGGVLADILLGHTPIGAVEIEPYARNILLSRQLDGRLPVMPIWDDVRTFRYDNPNTREFIRLLRGIREHLCICGGFPCQDISCAGRGEGIGGKKSGLWKEYKRIIREIRPKYVFMENSNFIVKRGLDIVLTDIAEMGYSMAWRLYRLPMLAHPIRENDFGELQFPTPCATGIGGSHAAVQWKKIQAIYPTPCTNGLPGCSGSRKKVMKNPNLNAEEKRSMCAGNGGTLNPEWLEWLIGFPVGWTTVNKELSGLQTKRESHGSQKPQKTGQAE